MKTFIQIAIPSGHVYEIPVAAVANNRAAYYHASHSDEFPTLESAMEDTIEVFKDDLYNIKDWASGNMNWEDLEPHARLIRFTPADTPWHEGEWTYHDHRAMVGELDGAMIMQSPVEFVAQTMMESHQLCNVTVLNTQDGSPFGAVVVIMGTSQVVDAFIATIKYTAEQITGGYLPPEATH